MMKRRDYDARRPDRMTADDIIGALMIFALPVLLILALGIAEGCL